MSLHRSAYLQQLTYDHEAAWVPANALQPVEDMYKDMPPLEEFTDDEDMGEVGLNQIYCRLDLKPASSWRLSLIELFPHL